MRYEKELQTVREIAAEAGKLALENQARGFEIETKSDESPVTSADKANEQLIVSRLSAAFPDDGVMGEEGAQRESRSGRRWIIDPIDGTRDFLRGLPAWAVLIGLEVDSDVAVGACTFPVLGQLYSAARGAGAFCNGEIIRASTATNPREAVVCLCGWDRIREMKFSPRVVDWLGKFWAARNMGGALDAMCVASGRADAWIEVRAKAWDLAPMKVIGEESGARFLNLDGGSSIHGGNCILTTPGLEAEIRRFLEI
jgi:histidinol-phosphatase